MTERQTAHRILQELATREHGIVSRQQLLAEGLTPRIVARWTADGRLRQIHRGVYLVGPVMPPLGLERAALLACGEDATLSHWTAGRVVGLPCRDEDGRGGVDVTVAVNCRRKRPGIRLHRIGRLHPREVQQRDGLRLTRVSRTLLDLAEALCSGGKRRRLEQFVAAALDERLTTEAELHDVARRHDSRREAGLLLAVLSASDGPMLTRSEAEEELYARILEAELPTPKLNARVSRYEVDFLWAAECLVVEMDGRAWHSSRRRFEQDRERDAELATRGYTVMRVTWRQVRDKPLKTVSRIAWVLGRLSAAAQSATTPPR
jgi:very-short-patch-repair endonuclease